MHLKFLVLFTLTILSALALAGDHSRYELTPADLKTGRKATCMQRIQEAITGLMQPGQVRYRVGHYGNLETLLDKSGVPSSETAGIFGWLDISRDTFTRRLGSPLVYRTS
jgi:hypothetical protein